MDRISDEVMDVLLHYEFPGNIRELENIMERAVTPRRSSVIEMNTCPGFPTADFPGAALPAAGVKHPGSQ